MRHSESEPQCHTGDRDRFFSTAAICVADGNLYLSSHIELLRRILKENNQSKHLATSEDYQLIAAQAQELGVGALSFRLFSRADQELRPTYELVRNGQMPQSETLLGKLLNSVLGEGKEGVPRKQRIDGHDLPEFSAVQRYLGPAGTFVTSLDDGWMCVGLMLAPQAAKSRLAEDAVDPTKTNAVQAEVGWHK